jgi:hypothetical protein
MKEVHLAEIGLGWIARDTGAMLHGNAQVSVAFDPKPC